MPIHWIKGSPSAPPPAGITLVKANAGNTGITTPTSLSASLGGTPSSGNKLILLVSSDATVSTPSGWTLDRSQVNNNGHYLFSKTSSGTETLVTVNPTVGASTSWVYLEYSGVTTLAATTSAGSGTGVASLATGTTSTTTGATGGIAIASWGQSIIASGATATTDSYTAGFVEVPLTGGGTADTCTTKASGTNVTCAVATVAVAADGTFTSTATFSAANAATGIIAVYRG